MDNDIFIPTGILKYSEIMRSDSLVYLNTALLIGGDCVVAPYLHKLVLCMHEDINALQFNQCIINPKTCFVTMRFAVDATDVQKQEFEKQFLVWLSNCTRSNIPDHNRLVSQ